MAGNYRVWLQWTILFLATLSAPGQAVTETALATGGMPILLNSPVLSAVQKAAQERVLQPPRDKTEFLSPVVEEPSRRRNRPKEPLVKKTDKEEPTEEFHHHGVEDEREQTHAPERKGTEREEEGVRNSGPLDLEALRKKAIEQLGKAIESHEKAKAEGKAGNLRTGVSPRAVMAQLAKSPIRFVSAQEPTCLKGFNAFVNSWTKIISVCPSLETADEKFQVGLFIHEAVHTLQNSPSHSDREREADVMASYYSCYSLGKDPGDPRGYASGYMQRGDHQPPISREDVGARDNCSRYVSSEEKESSL